MHVRVALACTGPSVPVVSHTNTLQDQNVNIIWVGIKNIKSDFRVNLESESKSESHMGRNCASLKSYSMHLIT